MAPLTSHSLPRLIAATGLTNLADGIAILAWAWAASLLTRDPLLVALPPVALRLPWFLFALPAGVVTDRVDRLRLMFGMDVLRAGAFGTAALVVWSAMPLAPAAETGTAELVLFAVLLGSAAVVGTAEVFRDTAAQTILPALVRTEDLERANARLTMVEMMGGALLGPAIGAVLIGSAIWLPFAANTLLFLGSLIALAGLRGGFAPPQRTHFLGWRAELGEGLTFLRGQPFLRMLAVVIAIWNFCHQMVVIGLTLHVQENLGLGPTAYGIMLAVGAAGGVLGGMVAERGIARIGAARAAQWSVSASVISFAAICVAPSGVILAVVLFFFEFTGIFWAVVSLSYRQRIIPNALLGRVSAVYRLLTWGMMPLGLLFSGLAVRAAETLMTRETALLAPFAIAAVLTAGLTVAVWRRLEQGFGERAGAGRSEAAE